MKWINKHTYKWINIRTICVLSECHLRSKDRYKTWYKNASISNNNRVNNGNGVIDRDVMTSVVRAVIKKREIMQTRLRFASISCLCLLSHSRSQPRHKDDVWTESFVSGISTSRQEEFPGDDKRTDTPTHSHARGRTCRSKQISDTVIE